MYLSFITYAFKIRLPFFRNVQVFWWRFRQETCEQASTTARWWSSVWRGGVSSPERCVWQV